MVEPGKGISATLAGVYAIRSLDEPTLQRLVRRAFAGYKGPDFGGVDVMVPDANGEAWVILGRWVDCYEPAIKQAATYALEALTSAAAFEALVVPGGAPGAITLDLARAPTAGDPRAIAVRPLWAYSGEVEAGSNGATRAEVEAAFATLPSFFGLHMGAPHWLGRGMTREGEQIRSVTPYVRVDFLSDRRLEIAAMAYEEDFQSWLAAFKAATRWL